jgi:membrane-associated phospholipid phosphatase
VHDWFRAHPSTVLDVLCAIPYGTFIFVTCAFAAYLYVTDYERMRRFAWNFFLMNVVGFTTYHLYPAAPPWYFHEHGCTVDLLARASEGPALAHVDRLLGVAYFAGMYGRASDVFGAMPSLHVAYPLLIVLYGWTRFGVALRAASVAFLLAMAFSAVYLDHHWILDLVAGTLDAVVMFLIVRWAMRARERARAEAA